MSLSRDDILGRVFPPVGKVDVPELGGEVCIAGVSVAAAEDIRKVVGGDQSDVPLSVRVTILFACDENGKPLFTTEDVPVLRGVPVAALNTIMTEALKLNGLSEEGKEEAKNGSGATGNDGSVSGSPSPSEEQSPS